MFVADLQSIPTKKVEQVCHEEKRGSSSTDDVGKERRFLLNVTSTCAREITDVWHSIRPTRTATQIFAEQNNPGMRQLWVACSAILSRDRRLGSGRESAGVVEKGSVSHPGRGVQVW